MFGRDFAAVTPALDGCVIPMSECAGHRPYPAQMIYDVGVGFHNPQLVRSQRTNVKLDCVHGFDAHSVMVENPSIGSRLIQLKNRADVTLDTIADDAGYRGRSSVQRFFHPDYDEKYLPLSVARKLAKALVGKGNPVITESELLALAGIHGAQSAVLFTPPRDLERSGYLPNDIPIYGTALGGRREVENVDGKSRLTVEQAELDRSEVLGYKRRPPALEGREAVYGVYVSGNSMFPRFSDGEAVLVDPKRPARIGDDVIVHLKAPDEHDGERIDAVLIKRLIRRNSDFIELQQFNPELTFRVPAADAGPIHRIVTIDDLL